MIRNSISLKYVALVFALSSATWAADSSSSSGSSASSNSISASGTVMQVSEGSFTPATMPKNSDRAKKSSAAAAAAKAGSVAQQINCMRMQADAMAETDPDAQYWKSLTAGLQCQQANESQKSAEKNEEDSKSLSGEDAPKAATFTPGSVTLASGGNEEPQIEIPSIETAPKKTSAQDTEAAADEKALTGSDTAKADDKKEDLKAAENIPLDLPKAALSPIQSGAVVYEDGSKNGAGNSPPGPNGQSPLMNIGGPSNSTSASNSKNDKPQVSEAIAAEIAHIERGIRQINSAGGESGGGGDSEAPKGSGILDALMAQLNPEVPQMPGMPSFESAQMVATESASSSAAHLNIFEYASYRYQLAAGQDNRIAKSSEPRRKPSVANRAPASASAGNPATMQTTAQSSPTDLLSASRNQ